MGGEDRSTRDELRKESRSSGQRATNGKLAHSGRVTSHRALQISGYEPLWKWLSRLLSAILANQAKQARAKEEKTTGRNGLFQLNGARRCAVSRKIAVQGDEVIQTPPFVSSFISAELFPPVTRYGKYRGRTRSSKPATEKRAEYLYVCLVDSIMHVLWEHAYEFMFYRAVQNQRYWLKWNRTK